MFEMITGERPFKGESLKTLGRQHMTKSPGSIAPSVARKYSKLAKRVDALVQRCLEKRPELRFATFAELRRELAECLWEAAPARASAPRNRTRGLGADK